MSAMNRFLGGFIPERSPDTVVNPITLLRSISLKGYLFILAGWIAWTCDGFDYFSLSLTSTNLSAQFDKTTTEISTAITLTLLFRSLGAVLFGILSDRFGRKWTLVVNLLLIAVFELGSSFAQSFSTFLAVRALFGVAMGGIWGQASNTALENIPVEARGLVSGFVQQGYAVGYLLAAVVNLTLVPKHTWRSLYWVGAGLSLFAAGFRCCLPESEVYLRARREALERGDSTEGQGKTFMKNMGAMLRLNWKRAIWAVLLMTGFNFLSHGSQDLYPTYLKVTKGLTPALASKATIIANCGAVVGGIFAGYFSQFTGRRLAIIIMLFWTAAFIPLWIIPSSFGGLAAGAFFVQSGVQGAWGVIPIYLAEISPPAYRATFGGVAYQLGNMISSAAAQIEARAGESLPVKKNGEIVYQKSGVALPDYAKVQGILIGVVIAWTMFFVLIGYSAHGAHFEEAKIATESGAGDEEPEDLVAAKREAGVGARGDERGGSPDMDMEMKGQSEFVERR